MVGLTDYELERQANIARNLALLEELNVKEAAAGLVSKKVVGKDASVKAKPVQPRVKRARTETVAPEPRRQSKRLRKETFDPNESPAKKRRREAQAEMARQRAEAERLEAEERARLANKPRHQDLVLDDVLDTEILTDTLRSDLTAITQKITEKPYPRRTVSLDDYVKDEKKENDESASLKSRLGKMKVVSRAKVTQNRIYSSAYHPERSKDLIFFGDKHGQLGIWDAQAPVDEIEDEDGNVDTADAEGGKYWRLQAHWPASAKSSISAIKFDPVNSHSVYTSSYDCTLRSTSFVTGSSREVFAIEDTLLSNFDMPVTGNEMWISDTSGGLTHLDLREDKSKARRWMLSGQKIGCVSVNPVKPNLLLCSSNDRSLRVWDARKLSNIPVKNLVTDEYPSTFEHEIVTEFASSPFGRGMQAANWSHGKSVSSAYWDPCGRHIVSTCYEDRLRIWNVSQQLQKNEDIATCKPKASLKHDCQTGKWVTILKAQWSPNPDVYPHFTIGNMKHSLDIIGCKGEVLAHLYDGTKITAVQAVTCSHPSIVERAASGNVSGRCVLWAPDESSD